MEGPTIKTSIMKELKITKGEIRVEKATDFSNGYYLYPIHPFAEMDANAELIADAFNTANKCGLLPSQLLEQRDELVEALNETDKDLCVLWGQMKEIEETNPRAEGLSDLISKWRKRNQQALNKVKG